MGNITRKIRIPTGYLFTGEYSKGELETLSNEALARRLEEAG